MSAALCYVVMQICIIREKKMENFVVQVSNQGYIVCEDSYKEEQEALKKASRLVRQFEILGDADEVIIMWAGEIIARWELVMHESGSEFVKTR